MISGIFVKILSITLLIAVGVILILGIGTLFKGGTTSKNIQISYAAKSSSTFIAIIVLIIFAYFFKN